MKAFAIKLGRKFATNWHYLRFALLVVLIILLGVVLYWVIWANVAPEWTGFGPYDPDTDDPRAKTLWEWMDLLLVPLVLAAVAFLFGQAQRKAQEKRDLEKQRADILQHYLDRMSDLLSRSENNNGESDQLKALARARTMTILPQLDGARKGTVLQFLAESGLISGSKPFINLRDADFSDTVLHGTFIYETVASGRALPVISSVSLKGINLCDANFSKSELAHVKLNGAHLCDTVFLEAKLNWADLTEAVLYGALLMGAKLRGANLSRADLSDSRLHSADLTDSVLVEADLRNAELFFEDPSFPFSRPATLTGADFTGVRYNEETRWPPGFSPEAAGAVFVPDEA